MKVGRQDIVLSKFMERGETQHLNDKLKYLISNLKNIAPPVSVYSICSHVQQLLTLLVFQILTEFKGGKQTENTCLLSPSNFVIPFCRSRSELKQDVVPLEAQWTCCPHFPHC